MLKSDSTCELTSVARPVGTFMVGILKKERKKNAILTVKDVRSRYEKKIDAYLRDKAAHVYDSDLVSLIQIHDRCFTSMIAQSDP